MIHRLCKNQYLVSVFKKGNTIIFGLIATAFFSRAMGPTIKGQYDTYLNIINILNVLLNLGVSTIYPNYKRKKLQWTESTFVAFSVCQFFIYVLMSILVGVIWHNITYGLIGGCIAISVLSIQMNNISLVEKYTANAIANMASVVVNALLAIAMFMCSVKDINIFLMCYCIKEATMSIIAISSQKDSIQLKLVNKAEITKILRNGFIPMLTNLLIMVNYRIDVIFLNIYDVEFYQIGLYTAGLALAEYAWIIPDIFKDVLINKTATGDNLESVKFCLRASSTFLIFAYAFMVFFGKFAIQILYGKAYLEAYTVTIIVFIGIYGMVYCKLLGALYLAQGRWNFYFFTLLGAVLINVISNNFFIPLLGIKGAAFTTIVAYSFAGIIFLLDFKCKYKYRLSELLVLNKTDFRKISQLIKRTTNKGE